MEDLLEVCSASRCYHVHVGAGLLEKVGAFARQLPFGRPGGRCVVITDDQVAARYGDAVMSSLRSGGFMPSLVVVPSGEASKSMPEAARVADELICAGLDRQGFIVALGGGVIGDLAGFVASIYYRGIPFIQVPTTIVSQVDSSIGGKTGVNASSGKNLLGTFYPPFLVLADTGTLRTLPAREFNEGMAEVIKHGVIRDAGMLRQLADFRRDDVEALTVLIRRNLQIKAAIVAADEFEQLGQRALLNFGHSVGHAIEQAAGYGRFLHGEAISLGMVAAGRLSMVKAGLPPSEYAEMIARLEQFGLPTRLPPELPAETILGSLARDKKFEAGQVRFVLTPRLGDAYVSSPGEVNPDDLREAVENLRTAPAREFLPPQSSNQELLNPDPR